MKIKKGVPTDYHRSVTPSIQLLELVADYAPDRETEILELLEEEQVSLSPYWGCARTVACYIPAPEWCKPAGVVYLNGDSSGMGSGMSSEGPSMGGSEDEE